METLCADYNTFDPKDFVPIIIHVWTSRKILGMELLCDASMAVLFMACFIAEVNAIGGNCPPGKSSGCDMLNWVLAWNFLSFIFWTIGAGFDIHSMLVGYGFCRYFGWEGERLDDLEMDASIRRLGRS
ncbi:hypothetical protein HDU96_006610 [Phlyctochytrium bullatum]|nr:hypothetical protein HDU96_006610 [Phlyctochytrium bullatum]